MKFIEIAGAYINPSQVTMIEKGFEEGEALIYLADGRTINANTDPEYAASLIVSVLDGEIRVDDEEEDLDG